MWCISSLSLALPEKRSPFEKMKGDSGKFILSGEDISRLRICLLLLTHDLGR